MIFQIMRSKMEISNEIKALTAIMAVCKRQHVPKSIHDILLQYKIELLVPAKKVKAVVPKLVIQSDFKYPLLAAVNEACIKLGM